MQSVGKDYQKEIEQLLVHELKLCSIVTGVSSGLTVGGGCINDPYAISTDKGNFFIKLNASPSSLQMFQAEFQGLKEIESVHQIRVPIPIQAGQFRTGESYLLMEHIALKQPNHITEKQLGRQLAMLHLRSDHQTKFGFKCDGLIGKVPQINTWCDDWITFYSRRLRFQLDLIKKTFNDEELEKLGSKLIEKLPQFFEGITIKPCLLHGDLWSGNWASDDHGNPVIFDPTCYYGHSEAELSIMSMFGGFGDNFFTEYHKHIPKEKGFQNRQLLYQVYHYLNHVNLFGEGYRSSCIRIIKKLIT